MLIVVFVSLQWMTVWCQAPGRGEPRQCVAVCEQCCAVRPHLDPRIRHVAGGVTRGRQVSWEVPWAAVSSAARVCRGSGRP